ncbi:MAG: phage integrase N-terminal SAM-like domain-containing protein [Bacteroidota bacterium]
MSQNPKLLDSVRMETQVRHMSKRTEDAYVYWIRKFILFHNKKHPQLMAEKEIRDYLSHLATDRKVSASTQNIALNAIVFLYKHVLKKKLNSFGSIVRADRPKKLPVVLSRQEIAKIFTHLSGVNKLIVGLLYGSGLRLMEALRLRVKDIDFDANLIHVRSGKGEKDRVTLLPQRLKQALKNHLAKIKLQHDEDLAEGFGAVDLPDALHPVRYFI